MICTSIALFFLASPAVLDPALQPAAQDRPAATPAAQAPQEMPKAKPLPSSRPADDPALAELQKFIESKAIDKTQPGWKTNLPKPPKATFSETKDYFWHMRTNQGDIKIRLMADVAPMHVSSTIYLTQLGFYDDLNFHRVIQGFMAQGGDPLGNGRGSAGYKYAGEFSDKVRHDKPGLLSMANSGPNTDGSQFFLTFIPTPHLNGKHTIFGEVVEGMDTVRKIEALGAKGDGPPTEKVLLLQSSISVEAKPKQDA